MRRDVVRNLGAGAGRIRLAEDLAGGLDALSGYAELKGQLRGFAHQALNPDPRLAALGVPATNGILLYGPPGNGKTSVVEALAAELHLDFLCISGRELAVGFADGRIRQLDDLLGAALRMAVTGEGVLVFFDELDALAEHGLDRGFRSALLGGIDRLRRTARMLLAAATNSYDCLDPAVIRPGRFDLHRPLDNPPAATIAELLTQLAGAAPFELALDDAALAALSEAWAEAGIPVSAIRVAVHNAKRAAFYAAPGEPPYPICADHLRLPVSPLESAR
jgi:transitional endoplasmic reticulum ATPase